MGRHPMRWLADQARTGVHELPANAAWLVSRAMPSGGSELTASMIDAAPGGGSVEARMERARAAAERAQEAKEDALEAARWSEESSGRVGQVTQTTRAWLAEVRRQADRRVEERVAEARRRADEQVERERAVARQEADEEVEEAEARATEEVQAAQCESDAAHRRGEEILAASRERLATARQLADEAVRAARAAAEEAHRQSQLVAAEAEKQEQGAGVNGAAASPR
jgi:colicin import membrane protein